MSIERQLGQRPRNGARLSETPHRRARDTGPLAAGVRPCRSVQLSAITTPSTDRRDTQRGASAHDICCGTGKATGGSCCRTHLKMGTAPSGEAPMASATRIWKLGAGQRPGSPGRRSPRASTRASSGLSEVRLKADPRHERTRHSVRHHRRHENRRRNRDHESTSPRSRLSLLDRVGVGGTLRGISTIGPIGRLLTTI